MLAQKCSLRSAQSEIPQPAALGDLEGYLLLSSMN
jgi:hypothetical protein